MICYLPSVQITSISSKISMIKIENGNIFADFSFVTIDLRYAFSICLLFLFRDSFELFNHFSFSIDNTPASNLLSLYKVDDLPSFRNLSVILLFTLNGVPCLNIMVSDPSG